jgi:hypothetical protein
MSTEMRWPVVPRWKGHPHHRSRRPEPPLGASLQAPSRNRRAGPTFKLANGGRPRGRSGAVATQERAIALRRRGCA